MAAIHPDLAGKVVLVTGGASGIGAHRARFRAPEINRRVLRHQ
jgi:NAD(P)-dependent dehydrogenase (short-subunit alcohol dehydrogenase family)